MLEQFLDIVQQIASQISSKIQTKIWLHDRFDQLEKAKQFSKKMSKFLFGVVTTTRWEPQNTPGHATKHGMPSFVALITSKECLPLAGFPTHVDIGLTSDQTLGNGLRLRCVDAACKFRGTCSETEVKGESDVGLEPCSKNPSKFPQRFFRFC